MKPLQLSKKINRSLLQHIALAIAITICATLLLYLDPLLFLIKRAIILRYGRLLMVPMGFLFLWYRRKEFRQLSCHINFNKGIIAVFLSCILSIAGQVTLLDSVTETAALATVFAIFYLVCGGKTAKLLFMPLFYIWFTLTFLERILPHIAIYSQYFSAWLASGMLKLLGLQVIRNGLAIRLGGGAINVAYWCSGVNQILALFALSLPFAWMQHTTIWKRLIVAVSALPIALLMNGFRIFLIGVWNYHEMKTDIHGPYDILLIPVIQPIAIAILFLISWLLRSKKSQTGVPPPAAIMSTTAYTTPLNKSFLITFCASVALFALSGLTVSLLHPKAIVPSTTIGNLPYQLGAWVGQDQDTIPPFLPFGQPDKQVYRTYTNNNGDEVFVYIATFLSQSGTNRLDCFCHPTDPLENRGIPVSTGNGNYIPGTNADCRDLYGNVPGYFYYFVNDKVITARPQLKRELAMQIISKGTSDGILVFFGWNDKKRTIKTEHMDLTLASFHEAIYPFISTSYGY